MNKHLLAEFFIKRRPKGLRNLYLYVMLTAGLSFANIGVSYSQFDTDFQLNPAKGCAIPHTVFFTDQSILPDTWFWNFGDGNTSTLQNPLHSYTSTGSFTVILTTTDTIIGLTDTHSELIEISVTNADFTGSTLFGCGPLTTTFSDGSSINGPGTIESWAWNFGDGSTSTDQNPTHTYNDPGIYTVSLTVTSSTGCSNTRTRTSYVQVIGPDVDFQINPSYTSEICLPQNIPFQDLTIFGAPITSWTWDFGDGASSNLQNPTHQYTSEGQFDVSLTVADIDGCSRTLTKENLIDTRDQVSPDIACPDTQSGTANALGEFTLPDYTGLATSSDDCDSDPVITQSPLAGTIVNGGITEITLTSTDVSGNSANCTFDVDVTDNTVPTVIISTTSDTPTNTSFIVSIVFSEAVQGFDLTDIIVSNATKGDFAITNALEYTTLITPITDGTATVNIPNASATDLAGNNNTASNQISLLYDVNAPTPQITGAPNTVNSISPFNITVQFDEAVADFVEVDLAVTNGTKSSFQSVDGDTYTVDITPDGNGDLTLNIGEGTAADLATNPNAAATEVIVTYDDIAPSVTLTTLATSSTNAPFEVIIQFSEPVTGFSADDLDITNGAGGVLTTVNASEYRISVTPSADGDIVIELAAGMAIDIADNGNMSATPLIIAYDATAPTLVFTNTPATLNSTDPVTISIQFSEAIEEFILDDISLINAAGSSLSSADQVNWTFELTPTGAGDITIDIAIDAAQDPAGNTTSDAAQASIIFDDTPPTVAISSAADIAINSSFEVIINFSEDVSGFELADIDPINATLDNFSIASASSYSVSINPTSEGLVSISIPANVAQDIAANQNTAATPFIITYDITEPQTQLSGAPAIVNTTDAFPVSIIFSEEITAFEQSDISIANASVIDLRSSDQITFTADITPNGSGDMTLSISANLAEDLASNPNAASEEVVIIFDNEAPVFTSSAAISLPENGTEVVFVTAEDRLDITFSIDGGEDMSLFSFDDATNALSFAVAPDYEAPQDQGANNTYSVIIKVTDEVGNESSQEIIVTITDRDENAPTFISSDEFSLLEGEQLVTTVTATDESSFQLSVTAGSDSDLFELDANGTLIFLAAPDFETPIDANGDNTYTLTITATDNAGNSTNQTLRITVTDLDEIKPIYNGSTSFNLNEGIINVATINFEDASEINYTLEDAGDGVQFNIGSGSGELVFIEAPDFETPRDQSGTNTYQIMVTATDNANNSSSMDLTIAVADVDENSPVFSTAGVITVDENQTAITSLDVEDESKFTLRITGGADQDLVNLNTATGELTFTSNPDFETPLDSGQDNIYNVSITATDALNNASTLDMDIAVVDMDENQPVFLTEIPISHPENETAVITIDATDESEITFDISSGVDAALFAIDPVSGMLTFVDTPDFENPIDSDQDNTYELEVAVTDIEGNTGSQMLVIEVNDVLEPLAVNISAPATINEGDGNLTFLMTLPEPSPVSTTLSYTLSGTASANTDYSDLSEGTLQLERGASSFELTLELIDDKLAEVSQTIVLSSVTGTYEGLIFPEIAVEVSLVDNDLATLNLELVSDGQEGVSDPSFRITTSAEFETDAIVEIRLAGTALSTEDYSFFETSLTIPAGESSVEVAIPLVDDDQFETAETLEVSIVVVPQDIALAGDHRDLTINILDNDQAPPLSVPTLFTPNNDGINDRFIIRGGGEVAEITFTIISREGHTVFQSTNWEMLSTNGWNGTSNGVDQPSEPYIWTVRAINIRGEGLEVNGASNGIIQLVR